MKRYKGETVAMEPPDLENIHAQNQRDAHAEEVLRLQGSQTPFGLHIWRESIQSKNQEEIRGVYTHHYV
jgi:hypothetical protein